MTCREKLAMEHPEKIDASQIASCAGCPDDYGYLNTPEWCSNSKYGTDMNDRCTQCWNREIPETPTEEKTLNEQRAEQGLDPVTEASFTERHILDSGDRTEFATGAVRDMREGKGRCDLMPLEVVAEWLKDDVLGCIAQFKIQGTTTFLYGALNYFLDEAGWSYYEACLEVAKHFEEGAKKYGENNWQKGIPTHCYIDSAIRHYFKFMCGMKDEPHDRAFVWNIMCCIWEVDYRSTEAYE